MKNSSRMAVTALTCLCLSLGCASSKVTDRQRLVTDKLPRPDRILVYDFVATPEDIPEDSSLAGRQDEHPAPQTAEQIEAGRKLGAEIASPLAKQIRDMGLQGEQSSAQTKPQINDIVIRGYLLSINQGSFDKRFVVGFGSGASKVKVAVEGFQMTEAAS